MFEKYLDLANICDFVGLDENTTKLNKLNLLSNLNLIELNVLALKCEHGVLLKEFLL